MLIYYRYVYHHVFLQNYGKYQFFWNYHSKVFALEPAHGLLESRCDDNNVLHQLTVFQQKHK